MDIYRKAFLQSLLDLNINIVRHNKELQMLPLHGI